MLFETLAMSGGNPRASGAGKVLSAPDPTTELIAPAATAAAKIARISVLGTRSPTHPPILGRALTASDRGPGGQPSGTARAIQRAPARCRISGVPKHHRRFAP